MVRYIYNIRYAPAAPESSSWAHPKSACRVMSHTFHLGQHSIQNGTPPWHQGAWRAGRHQPEHPFDGVLQTPPAAGAADAAGAAKVCGFTLSLKVSEVGRAAVLLLLLLCWRATADVLVRRCSSVLWWCTAGRTQAACFSACMLPPPLWAAEAQRPRATL